MKRALLVGALIALAALTPLAAAPELSQRAGNQAVASANVAPAR